MPSRPIIKVVVILLLVFDVIVASRGLRDDAIVDHRIPDSFGRDVGGKYQRREGRSPGCVTAGECSLVSSARVCAKKSGAGEGMRVCVQRGGNPTGDEYWPRLVALLPPLLGDEEGPSQPPRRFHQFVVFYSRRLYIFSPPPSVHRDKIKNMCKHENALRQKKRRWWPY
jgi:hypothetical protein